MEIAWGFHAYLKHEKHAYRWINLNNVTKRVAAGTEVNRDLVCKISLIEDVLSSKTSIVCLSLFLKRKIPEIFSSAVCRTIWVIYLKDNQVPTLYIVFERLNQKTAFKLTSY